MNGGSPEPNQEPFHYGSIPPYEYPVSPEKHIVPEPADAPDNVAVRMAHPETVTLPPVQEVVRQPESLTGVKEKPLTNGKKSAPEKINEKLSNQPQNDNFPVKKSVHSLPAPTAKKLPKKMQFKGKKGRQRTEAEVRDLLTFVQNRNGAWPNDNYVSEQMRRYYRREYPEYFRKAKGKKVHAARSAPIDMASRRAGNA